MATATMVLTDGTIVKTITDGGAGDTSPTAGSISVVGGLGVFDTLNINAGFTKDFLGSAESPQMLFSGTQAGSKKGTLDAWFGDSGYLAVPLSGVFTVSNFATGAGETNYYELCYKSGADLLANIAASPTSNCEDAAIGGTLVASDTLANGAPDSATGIGGYSTTAPYSLAIHVRVAQASAGTSTFESRLVSEPASFAAWGIGLVGLSLARRRSKKSKA